ncbi:MAG: hypothetical protein IIX23_04865 [Oscillospiraceae bacterium]|nr:hypothetical protein [Oscillospiraceae bacterium]
MKNEWGRNTGIYKGIVLCYNRNIEVMKNYDDFCIRAVFRLGRFSVQQLCFDPASAAMPSLFGADFSVNQLVHQLFVPKNPQ